MLRSGKIARLKEINVLLDVLKSVINLRPKANVDAYITVIDELQFRLTKEESSTSSHNELIRKLYQPQVIHHLADEFHLYSSLDELMEYLNCVVINNINDENFESYYGA